MSENERSATEKFSFASSVAADVWSPKPDARSYEWWYFDALSDDGRDAVVIIFLDNFVFSPRYNRLKSGPSDSSPQRSNVPAVAFFYYRDGRILHRSINEFKPEDFESSSERPFCRIGKSEFTFESAPYGHGYLISVRGTMVRGRRLEADFEWVAIESDFTGESSASRDQTHNWNLVAPRADVSGRVRVTSSGGREIDKVHFRGTGYHDHNFDSRWLPDVVADWQWGRVHFSDCTAVYYRYREVGSNDAVCKLFVVYGGVLKVIDAEFTQEDHQRNVFGVKYPRDLVFSGDDVSLIVSQRKVIDASFFYLRFLAEIEIILPDGKRRKATGITECLEPRTLRWRVLDWMVSMRIGSAKRGAIIR